MTTARYVIDANSLIQAWAVYPENHFPDLWAQLERLIAKKRLQSPAAVRDELDAGSDQLKKWARQQKDFFVEHDEAVQKALRTVMAIPGFVQPAGRRNYADPWLVALGKHLGAVVITEEKGKGHTHGALKVPDMCRALQVHHSRFQGLFASENWTFKLR
ncbi:MAG: DUF4411 family protein [Myxococcaceae bacterium]